MIGACERAAEIAAALMKRRHSLRTLAAALGMANNNNECTLLRYINQFKASGCIYRAGSTPKGAAVYAWQPELFQHEDRFEIVELDP